MASEIISINSVLHIDPHQELKSIFNAEGLDYRALAASNAQPQSPSEGVAVTIARLLVQCDNSGATLVVPTQKVPSVLKKKSK
jgi:hypothetical protein